MALTKQDNEDTSAVAHEPDRTLRKLVGETATAAEIFPKDRIAEVQKAMDDARGTFFDTAMGELEKLEGVIGKNPNLPDKSDFVFEDIAVCASNIKGPAEMFGFALVASISDHVLGYCSPGARTPAARYLLIADLVKMLRIALKERITNGERVGQELRASLKKY